MGASYLGITHPSTNSVNRRNNTSNQYIRDDSIISIGDLERKYEQNGSLSSICDSLKGRNGSLTSSHNSFPSVDVSLSTINSGTFKFKTQLLSRYSSQLEEENKVLKELLRNNTLKLSLI